MHIIGVLNGKGGVGKTTLTACLAVRAAKDGAAQVAVVDLDPANSYAEWYARRGSPDNPTLFRGVDRASDAVEALRLTSPYTHKRPSQSARERPTATGGGSSTAGVIGTVAKPCRPRRRPSPHGSPPPPTAWTRDAGSPDPA
jgi:CobQ/CobB/MinD/ParA nucleotide binding domain